MLPEKISPKNSSMEWWEGRWWIAKHGLIFTYFDVSWLKVVAAGREEMFLFLEYLILCPSIYGPEGLLPAWHDDPVDEPVEEQVEGCEVQHLVQIHVDTLYMLRRVIDPIFFQKRRIFLLCRVGSKQRKKISPCFKQDVMTLVCILCRTV